MSEITFFRRRYQQVQVERRESGKRVEE